MNDNQLQEKIQVIINSSESDFRKRFFKSEKIYNQLVGDNISAWKIYNDPNISEVWVLDDTSKRIDVREPASNFIAEILDVLNLTGISLETEKLNISQLFNEAQRLLKQKYANQSQVQPQPVPTLEGQDIKEIIYNSTIVEFGLEHLPKEDRDEIIVELAKTIQKQFLLDVYEKIGDQNFKALETSASMGKTFYETTLKHLLPDYDSLFKASRNKVVTAFKKV